ncbi:MAG: undecaprenyl/decaprenyl-phosphate alpha-N-acetylglucosaminyl 1-phosphate transferase [Planctomycetes bacterium]|nr:undecaprenyl/decaprenyl-phosphate alpha-N-acetylglucosaminyl 1-phosphate transferase [Planctomycetota bacterium]
MSADPLLQMVVMLALGAACSAAGVGAVRRLAGARGWNAPVRSDRWHSAPTALFGGVGICVGLLAAIAFARGISGEFRDATSLHANPLLALIVCTVAAASVGLIDDMLHLAPRWKLALQALVASGFLWSMGGVQLTGIDIIDTALAFLWILSVMNAVNMIDNMDGVAATVAMIGLGGISLGLPSGTLKTALRDVALLASGASLGFLFHNAPPARIFMGDCGSLMLGFLLAALPLLAGDARLATPQCGAVRMWSAAALAIGCCAVPLADMIFVSLSRLARGVSPLQGGRDHSTHLLAARLGQRSSAVFVVAGGLAAMFAAAGIAAADPSLERSASAAIIIGIAAVVGVAWRWLRQVADDPPSTPRLHPIWPLVRMLLDVAVMSGALQLGYLLRWEFVIPPELRGSIGWSLPLVVASCVAASALRGEYWSAWRGGGLQALRHATVSALLGAGVATAAVAAAWTPDRLYSRWSMAIFAAAYIGATVLVRASVWALVGVRR